MIIKLRQAAVRKILKQNQLKIKPNNQASTLTQHSIEMMPRHSWTAKIQIELYISMPCKPDN